MENYFASNLAALRKKRGDSQTELATSLGLKRTTYMNYESGHTEPNLQTAIKIASLFGVSLENLMQEDLRIGNLIVNGVAAKEGNNSGNLIGNLIAKNEDLTVVEERPSFYLSPADIAGAKSSPKVVTTDLAGEETVVMIPVKARAGYLTGYGDEWFIEKLPVYKLPNTRNGTYRIFEVDGVSMFPTLQDKDLAIARWVRLSEVREDKVHVLVTRNNGILIKRVLAREKEGYLICKSDHNEKGHYPDIVLDLEDVVECWFCVERMTRHLPSPGEIHKRITDLEADMALLKKQLSTR